MKTIIILTLSILLFSYAVNAEDISAPTDVGRISITSFSNLLLYAIIPAVATVISPIVIWILNHSGRSHIGVIRQHDYMLKRLELVSKLNEVKQKHGLTDNPKLDWNILEEETSDVLSSILVSIKELREETKKKIHISKLSWIEYYLLWYRPASRAGWTFRCLYYYVFFGAISIVITLLLNTFGLRTVSGDYKVFIFWFLSYGILACLFQYFAIQNYKSYLVNGKIIREETIKEIDISKLSWIKYVLLWYRPASPAGCTFLCLYYWMLGSEIYFLLAKPIGLITTDDLSKDAFGIIVLMTGGLAYLFHLLAIRNYKRCFANLEFLREEIKKEIDISKLSWIKYYLLWYRPASPAGWTFLCLYYWMLVGGICAIFVLVMIGFGLADTIGLMEPSDTLKKEYFVWISFLLMYGGLAFLLHFLTIRDYKNSFTKIKSKVESMLASIE